VSWKKTDLERLKAASLTDRMKRAPIPERFGKGATLAGSRAARRAAVRAARKKQVDR
jgi:hypothetical protein